jgi:arylsulfatase
MCSVRSTRWHLVSEKGAAKPKWALFDLETDYGEQTDVAAQHPEVVRELAAAFDKFWADARPRMVNEQAVGPALNPFQELYYKQFGGSPTAEDLAKMDPNRKLGQAASKAAKTKSKQASAQ